MGGGMLAGFSWWGCSQQTVALCFPWETGMANRGAAFVLSGSAVGALLGVSSPGGLPVPLLDMPTQEGNASLVSLFPDRGAVKITEFGDYAFVA
uniref:Putative secreted protein n=1 Tax=Ixodes ricinus TaxID=34613 RepID=A0A6B0UCU2_IXORI